jgi:hypothetical protein
MLITRKALLLPLGTIVEYSSGIVPNSSVDLTIDKNFVTSVGPKTIQ